MNPPPLLLLFKWLIPKNLTFSPDYTLIRPSRDLIFSSTLPADQGIVPTGCLLFKLMLQFAANGVDGERYNRSPVRCFFMITEDLPNTKKTNSADLSWLCQPAQGYRFTEDAMVLANFVTIHPDESLLDLCSGVGIVPIALAQHHPFAFGIGVEIQEALIVCARKNLQIAGMADCFAMMQRDVCQLHAEDFHSFYEGRFLRGFDVVSANPPFHRRHSGRLNPNWQRAIARHELLLTLTELVASAWRCLKPGGRFYLVHRADRQKEIEALMLRHRMAVARVGFPPGGNRRTPLILLESVKEEGAQATDQSWV